jgi:hypothetical protein
MFNNKEVNDIVDKIIEDKYNYDYNFNESEEKKRKT